MPRYRILFLSFIPAAFIGAPEGDTALYLLPAHCCLLLEVILNFGLSYPVVGFEVEICVSLDEEEGALLYEE